MKNNIDTKNNIFILPQDRKTSKTVIFYPAIWENTLVDLLETLTTIKEYIYENTNLNQPIVKIELFMCLNAMDFNNLITKMSKSLKESFSKLIIIAPNKAYEYDGWNSE